LRAMVLAGGLYRRQAGSYKSTSFVARMKSGRNMLATPGFHPGYTLPTLRARRHGAGGYQPVGARLRAMVLAGGPYRRQAGSCRSTSFVARMKSGRNMLATPGFHPGYTLPTLRAQCDGAGGCQPVGARLRAMVLAGGLYRRQAGSYRSTSFVARMKFGRNMLATPGFHPGYTLEDITAKAPPTLMLWARA